MTENNPGHILFVCTGNTCRSPMAEYIYNNMVREIDGPRALSAGLLAADGEPATRHANKVLRDYKIDLTPHRSRMLDRQMLADARLVVTMTEGHKNEVLRRFPECADRVVMLTEFSPAVRPHDISDPIGGTLGTYRTARDAIDSALADLVLHLRDVGVLKDRAR